MTVEDLVREQLGPDSFPRNLRMLRVLRNFNQEDLSRESGVDPSTISLLENGKQRPRPGTLRKLAEALDVPLETLKG